MQGSRVQSLVREDSAYLGATKPRHCNCWARVPRERALRQQRPLQWEACLPQLEKAWVQRWRPSKILKRFFFFNEWMKWKNGKLDYSRKENFCLLIKSHSHDFPVDCSPPGSSVHGMLQAKILEWVTTPSSRGSSQSRDRTQVSHTAGRHFTIWATREAPYPKENSCSLKNTVKE